MAVYTNIHPSSLHSEDSPSFFEYGQRETKKIAAHYHKDKTKSKEQYENKLMAKSQKFKYDMLSWKKDMLKDILTYCQGETKQPTNMDKENVRKFIDMEWCLEHLVRMQHEYGHHYPELLQFAQTVLPAPVTNAWPECGANAIKLLRRGCEIV